MTNRYQKVYILLAIAVCIVNARIYIQNGNTKINLAAIDYQTSFSQTCASEVNNARINNGRNPISYQEQVEAVAKYHNDYMIATDCFDHQCPGESSSGDLLRSTGYIRRASGEIIAKGQANCQAAINAWLNSPDHRHIMLGNYQHFGCSSGQRYWTCVFARPASLE